MTLGRGTELKLCRLSVDLYIGGETGNLINLGFPQCKTIIMPLIFQSPVPLFLCLLLLVLPSLCYIALAKLSDVLFATSLGWEREPGNGVGSLCSSVSCWRLLLRCFWSRRSRSRGVSVEIFLGEDLEPLVVLVRHLQKLFVIHRC